MGAGRVRGADLHRPFWGVRAPTPPTDVAALTRSYLERAHPTLDVGVPSPKRAQVARGIRGHKLRLRIGDLEMLGDIPVTSAPRTWFDIAPLLSVDYEGDHHRTDPTQWQRDIQRVRRLEAIDWHLTRGAAGDLRDSRELIGQIAANLRAKGWKG